MPKATFAHVAITLTVVAVIATLTGCSGLSPGQTDSGQETSPVTPLTGAPDTTGSAPPEVASVRIRRTGSFTSLEELVSADLIIEGTITGENTRFVPDTTATEAELAERQAQGLPIGVDVTEYEVAVDRVLKGQTDSGTVIIIPAGAAAAPIPVGNSVILFLVDISGNPIHAPGQTKYMVIAPEGQFRVENDNTLFAYSPPPHTLTESYRGKDKSVLENDILDLAAKLPTPTKEELLPTALSGYNGAELVIEGTIQGIQEVHFINSLEKPQEWIDQMLAEGKMPGLLLTDYTVTVDKVLFDKRADNPRFFPDWKPLEPGQTIIMTRQGGAYRGVTKIEEPGPPFELGSREILFLSGFSLINYDVPDDGQVRYSTDSRRGRLLIGADGKLTAFTAQGLGGIYGGQDVGQLEQDIAEFLKTYPLNERIQVPPQP